MDSFFGTPWPSVTLDTVRAFLADAESEGLTWEAKGTERPHPGSIRKAVCAFGNSERGGFLILGASRNDPSSAWRLDPLEFGDEPTAWLSRVIRGGVTPVPFYDIREWSQDGGHVAVVRIDAVAEPPCMTTSGEVFVRVSGESVRVTDPETLRRLYTRGEEQVARAITKARRRAEPESEARIGASLGMGRLGMTVDRDPSELRLRVAITPVAAEEETETRVFRHSFAERVLEIIGQLPLAPLFPYSEQPRFASGVRRSGLIAFDANERDAHRWTIEVDSDATVMVALNVEVESGDAALLLSEVVVREAVRPAIAAASSLIEQAGGRGRCYLVVSMVGRHFEVRDSEGHTGEVPEIPDLMLAPRLRGHEYRDGFEAWIDPGHEPSPELLGGIERDLLRACAVSAWEPEGEPETNAEEPAPGS